MINGKTIYATAVFEPRVKNDLKPPSLDFIGKRLPFDKGALIDYPPYEGEWAMWCRELEGWVPSGDLVNIIITEELDD